MLLQFFWRTAKMTPNWTNGLSEAFNRKFTFAFSALALYASGLGLSLLALALAYWPCFTGLGLSLLALVLAYWHWLAYWPWLCMSAVVLRTRTHFGRRAFSVCRLDIWNSFPLNISLTDSHAAFRRACMFNQIVNKPEGTLPT